MIFPRTFAMAFAINESYLLKLNRVRVPVRCGLLFMALTFISPKPLLSLWAVMPPSLAWPITLYCFVFCMAGELVLNYNNGVFILLLHSVTTPQR